MPARPRSNRTTPTGLTATRTQRLAMERVMTYAHEMHEEGQAPYFDLADKIPDAWDTLERDVDVDEPREKVTLYLDRSVAKFWRAQGKGYHDRINRVLATYAQLQIAGVNATNEWWRRRREEIKLEKLDAARKAAEGETGETGAQGA